MLEAFAEQQPGWHKYRGRWRRVISTKIINTNDPIDRFLIKFKIKEPKLRATYEYKDRLSKQDVVDFLWG